MRQKCRHDCKTILGGWNQKYVRKSKTVPPNAVQNGWDRKPCVCHHFGSRNSPPKVVQRQGATLPRSSDGSRYRARCETSFESVHSSGEEWRYHNARISFCCSSCWRVLLIGGMFRQMALPYCDIRLLKLSYRINHSIEHA